MVWKTDSPFMLANFQDIQKNLLYCFKKAGILNIREINNEEENVNV